MLFSFSGVFANQYKTPGYHFVTLCIVGCKFIGRLLQSNLFFGIISHLPLYVALYSD